MRDWERYVSERLPLAEISPARRARIVAEIASQLDEGRREALARGATASEADALARGLVADWPALAASIAAAEAASTTRPDAAVRGAPSAVPERPALLGGLWHDIRYATRQLRARPGFSAVAILTLALGIAGTTAVFSVVYGVVLKPLPFHDPARLVGVYHRSPALNLPVMNHGPATYFTYQAHGRAFDAIGAWESTAATITGRGDPERVEALTVTSTTLPLLGVQPSAGRLFGPDDDAPGAPLRVVLTHRYWRRAFGSAPDVIGKRLLIDGTPAEVIGVLPASYRFLRSHAAIVLPLRLDPADAARVEFDFQVIARLKAGVTMEQANADVARMIPLLPAGHEALQLQPNVRPLAADVIGDLGRLLWVLLAAVGLVLLIACANVANLFLVRAEGRQQEIALRAALGASRGRIARELLAESVLLGLAAGGLGVVLTYGALGLLRRLAPIELPRVDEIGLDPAVLAFALGISLLTGMLFGLVPVVRIAAPEAAVLREGGRGASDGPKRHRIRNALVVAEVALALVLLVVSGLMIRTFLQMLRTEPGFTAPHEVQTFRVPIPEGMMEDLAEAAGTHERIAQRLAQVPGVTSVGLASSITMDGEDNTNPLYVEHVPVPDGQMPPLRRFKSAAPGYHETMGNRIVAGRAMAWSDIHHRRRVVVISEALARESWGEPARAIGARVRGAPDAEWSEVIGVSGDERDDGLNQPATAMVYWPMLNDTYARRTMAYAVRSARVGAPGFVHELQQAVWSVNPNLPLARIQTLAEIQSASMAQTSFALVMLAIAGAVALLLGAVGLYSVIAYIAAQRTREIGIRMALGARPADVGRMVLAQGMTLASAGILVGLAGAAGATRLIRALLYETSPMDLATFGVVIPILAAAALLACWIPARRAMRADPMAALRYD